MDAPAAAGLAGGAEVAAKRARDIRKGMEEQVAGVELRQPEMRKSEVFSLVDATSRAQAAGLDIQEESRGLLKAASRP